MVLLPCSSRLSASFRMVFQHNWNKVLFLSSSVYSTNNVTTKSINVFSVCFSFNNHITRHPSANISLVTKAPIQLGVELLWMPRKSVPFLSQHFKNIDKLFNMDVKGLGSRSLTTGEPLLAVVVVRLGVVIGVPLGVLLGVPLGVPLGVLLGVLTGVVSVLRPAIVPGLEELLTLLIRKASKSMAVVNNWLAVLNKEQTMSPHLWVMSSVWLKPLRPMPLTVLKVGTLMKFAQTSWMMRKHSFAKILSDWLVAFSNIIGNHSLFHASGLGPLVKSCMPPFL